MDLRRSSHWSQSVSKHSVWGAGAGNFYCIYKRRVPGELLYNKAHEGTYLKATNVPDCANWRQTLTSHAAQIRAAGIDYVAADMVRLPRQHERALWRCSHIGPAFTQPWVCC